jgi:transposase/nucleoside-diphosphate-sugar epimerase
MDVHKPVVLITGSEGRLGAAIAAELAGAYQVVGFERACKGADCIDADLASELALAQGCRALRARHGNHLAAVIHLAAFYEFSAEPNPLYEEVNVTGTARLLRALQDFEVDQFVYASTMLVHAPSAPGEPINEDGPLKPAWPYPQSKLDAERVVEAERGAIPAVILRIAGVYTDAGELPSLAYQIQRIYERQMVSRVFPGDTSHGQALVHLADVAQAFRAAFERRAQLPPSITLLIGEAVTESYQALQDLLGRLLHGEAWETRQIPKSVAATGAWLQGKVEQAVPDVIDGGVKPFIQPFMVELADDHYELDITRAEQTLGWRPVHAVRRTLPTIIGALRQDPAGWYRRNKIALPPWLEPAPGQAPGAAVLADFHALDRIEHQRTLWCHFANVALGLWLASSPFILGLAQHWGQAGPLASPNGRGLPYSDTWMTASDVGSGALLVLFGLLSLSRDAGWARWAAAATGLWLLFAPLLFWTGSAAAYADDRAGRQALPPELPRVEQRHEPESCQCGQCGKDLVKIGEDISEQLDVEPARFFVHRHIRPQYACRACETVTAAQVPPAVIDGGLAAPGLLAWVAVSKYADHLPLYRIEQIAARQGVTLARSTLAEWVGKTGVALQPLADRLAALLRSQPVLHADETPVRQLDPASGKTLRAYLWAYHSNRFNAGPPIIVFDYQSGRAGAHARAFLGTGAASLWWTTMPATKHCSPQV